MMKRLLIILAMTPGFCSIIYAQDTDEIKGAVMDYVDGFYIGDTTKIIRSINADLSKFGYSKSDETGAWKGHQMTYERAIGFAREVDENPKWAAPEGAVREIEILDAMDKIASVKLTAYWGVDYLLLANYDGKWMVTKVLWQSTD